MGFLDKAKRAVKGPVTIDITVPPTFSWTDQALTITANLANETDRPLAVHEVRFTLEAATSGNQKGSTSRLKMTVPGGFVLDPGAAVGKTVELRLSRDLSTAAFEGAATEAALPSWVGTAMKGLVGDPPHRLGAHRVSAVVKLDGSSRLSNGSAKTSAV